MKMELLFHGNCIDLTASEGGAVYVARTTNVPKSQMGQAEAVVDMAKQFVNVLSKHGSLAKVPSKVKFAEQNFPELPEV